MRLSALVEHKKCKAHLDGCRKAASTVEVSQSKAGKALTLLKSTQRAKLSLLFRNVHDIVKNNRPLRDYVWLYDLDVKKDLFEGETYRSQKSALPFLSSSSDIERQQTAEMVKQSTFFAFLMDGSTDIDDDDDDKEEQQAEEEEDKNMDLFEMNELEEEIEDYQSVEDLFRNIEFLCCIRACVRAFVRACVCACVRACACLINLHIEYSL